MLVVWDAAQHGKPHHLCLNEITAQHHGLGLIVQHPVCKGLAGCKECERLDPLALEVGILHVQELLMITECWILFP